MVDLEKALSQKVIKKCLNCGAVIESTFKDEISGYGSVICKECKATQKPAKRGR